VKWLRAQIGIVSQEPTLFSTTIRLNIAYGLIRTMYENASEEVKTTLVKNASIKAKADSFITKLPLGCDTLVGEREFHLSGGQKQHVAIARAIIGDLVSFFDEERSSVSRRYLRCPYKF